ncbi:MAG: flagellin [Novosphingobium sp.]|nr:flagellin [Novosphingobium sp.]
MAFSVNTNAGAMAALQSLNKTNNSMNTVQSRINTGLNVAGTADDSAKYTVAQNLRGDLGKLSAVTSSLNNAKSVTDVAVAGAEQISDILNQMKSKTQEAADAGLDQDSRAAIAKDLTALKKQIGTIIDGSEFNGTNVLKKGGGNISALQSFQDSDSTTTGYQTDSLSVTNLALDEDTAAGGFFVAVGAAGTPGGLGAKTADITLTTAADAGALMESVDALAKGLDTKISDLGAASRKIDGQLAFTSKLSDVVETGIGNLVDADLAKESAKLQALQVQQQLGVQALSIANQAPQTILSLFR